MVKKLGWIFWIYVITAVLFVGSLFPYASEALSLTMQSIAALTMIAAVVLHWIYKVRNEEPVFQWAFPAVALALSLILCAVAGWIHYFSV